MHADLIEAFRSIKRRRGFAAAAIVTLGLAIGVNTAAFAVADAILFRPLPYRDPHRLYLLRMLDPQSGKQSPYVPPAYVEALSEVQGIESIAGRGTFRGVTYRGSDGTESVGMVAVSPDYFTVLGVNALHGRLFQQADTDNPETLVVLTHAAWRQRYAGDPAVVGQSAMLAGRGYVIVGVLPRGFLLPAELATVPTAHAGTRPYEFVTVRVARALTPRGAMEPIVRLREGNTLRQAEAQMAGAVRALAPPGATSDLVPTLVDLRSVVFPAGGRSCGSCSRRRSQCCCSAA